LDVHVSKFWRKFTDVKWIVLLALKGPKLAIGNSHPLLLLEKNIRPLGGHRFKLLRGPQENICPKKSMMSYPRTGNPAGHK